MLRIALIGEGTCQHLVEHDTERPNVASFVVVLAKVDFRSFIERSTDVAF